jgi:cytochrome c biogenesis protein CcmG/thiol:disulfide interchange protein DsbE
VIRWLSLLPLVVLVALAALFAGYALHHDPHVQPHAMVGKPMPDLTLPALDDGRPLRLRELAQGRPVLVNFFASWCAPCATEASQLAALQARGVRVIGVAYKDKPPETQAFLDRLGDPYAARLNDRDGRAGVEFGITGVPETFLVAGDGTILEKRSAPLTDGDVAELSRRALAAR